MKTVAIFMAGQAGDILSASSVLRYRDELWGNHKLVWYIDDANRDLLKYQDIELRTFPRGFGYPEMVIEENLKLVEQGKEPVWEDWAPLVNPDNTMNTELKKQYPSLADIDIGYFPAPHQMPVSRRHGIDYPNVSRKVFGIPDHYEWHPVIMCHPEELDMAAIFIEDMAEGKTVMIETFAGSGQSKMFEEMVIGAMNICEREWGACNFLFASHKFLRHKEQFPEGFFEAPNVYSLAEFTVRQCGIVAKMSDLLISVSSGITVAASAWGAPQPPTVQFTGSFICSTKSLANGPFMLVTADGKPLRAAEMEFYNDLTETLKKYK